MHMLRYILFITAVLLFLAIVGVAGYLYTTSTTTEPVQQTYDYREPYTAAAAYEEYLANHDRNEEISGQLFITGPARSGDAGSDDSEIPIWSSHFYNFETGEYGEFDTEFPYYYLVHHDELDANLFIAKPTRANPVSGNMDLNPGLYVQDDSEVVRELPTNEGNTSDSYFRMRLPQWSSDGEKYLYSAQVWKENDIGPQYDDVTTWQIGVGPVDGATTTSMFANGYGAQWAASDEYIVYVKQDGIYAKRYVEGAEHEQEPEHLLVTDKYTYSLRNQIGISPDGNYLAISYPVLPYIGNSHVDLYKLNFGGETPSAELIHRIAVGNEESTFWPQFSPGGRFISLQTLAAPDSDTSNYIGVYDFVSESFVERINFDNFYFDYVFNTDWARGSEI